jgi:hypothetical protein
MYLKAIGILSDVLLASHGRTIEPSQELPVYSMHAPCLTSLGAPLRIPNVPECLEQPMYQRCVQNKVVASFFFAGI